ncbi:hypothetical protein ABZY00_07620 [Streptomyces griseoflavus]|uniref:hypothetical protein n=1 Tax=Streptomyces griseoflavus TaxID=35619 RepID=UPI0033B352AF
MSTAPAAGAEKSWRPGPRRLASLLAGRTAFRLTLLGANTVLLANWGQGPYERYAAAMGTAQVLTTVTSLGIEKSALKLVPRARRTGPQLITVFLACASLLTTAVVLWLAGTALLNPPRGGAVALLAGLYMALLGLNTVLVGLCRALGRDRADIANFTALSVVVVTGTGGATLLGWGPEGFTGWILGGTALLNLVHVPALLRSASRPVRRGAAVPAVSTSALMACGDVAAAGTVSVLFALLGASRHHEQTGHLYLMVLASSVLLNGFGYVLRLFQPHVSLTLRTLDAATLDRRVVRRLLPLAVAGAAWTAAALLLARSTQGSGLLPPPVVVLLLYVLCTPLVFAMGSLNYLLENAGAHTLRATAAGAAAGLACAVLAGAFLVPALGAIGAVGALAAGEAAHALAAWLLLGPTSRPRRPPTPPAPLAPAALAAPTAPAAPPVSVASAAPVAPAASAASAAPVASAAPTASAASAVPARPAAPVAVAAPAASVVPAAPAVSTVPAAPVAPVAPVASAAPGAPAAPTASAASAVPAALAAPVALVAPSTPTAPAAPAAPAASAVSTVSAAPAASAALAEPAAPAPAASEAPAPPAALTAPATPADRAAPAARAVQAEPAAPAARAVQAEPAAPAARAVQAEAAAPAAPAAPVAAPAPDNPGVLR